MLPRKAREASLSRFQEHVGNRGGDTNAMISYATQADAKNSLTTFMQAFFQASQRIGRA